MKTNLLDDLKSKEKRVPLTVRISEADKNAFDKALEFAKIKNPTKKITQNSVIGLFIKLFTRANTPRGKEK